MQDPDPKCRHFVISWHFMAFWHVCQKANCITKSAFSAFSRLFPLFRLFHRIRLLDFSALVRILRTVKLRNMYISLGIAHIGITINYSFSGEVHKKNMKTWALGIFYKCTNWLGWKSLSEIGVFTALAVCTGRWFGCVDGVDAQTWLWASLTREFDWISDTCRSALSRYLNRESIQSKCPGKY